MPEEGSLPILRLTTLIVRGDNAAFKLFFDTYHSRIYRFLLVAAKGNDSLARDVLQDTFVRAARYMKLCSDADQLWRWLTRLARTALIDQIRINQRREKRHLAAGEFEYTTHGDAEMTEKVLMTALDLCLPRLAPTERGLIESFYFEGLSHVEIALRHGLTEKAVESRLGRLRQRLRNLILEQLRHAES